MANVEAEGQVLGTRPLSADPWQFHTWPSKVHHSSPFQWASFTFLSERVKSAEGASESGSLSLMLCVAHQESKLCCSWRVAPALGFPVTLPRPTSDLCPDVPWGEVVGRRAWCRGVAAPWRLPSLPRIFQTESKSLRFGPTFTNMPVWDKNSIMTILTL